MHFYNSISQSPKIGFLVIALGCLLATSCQNGARIKPFDNDTLHKEAPCVNISGLILGKPVEGSFVYLYETDQFGLDQVLDQIGEREPFQFTKVTNGSKFLFTCVGAGSFAAALPVSSYHGSAGAPLPYEFDCDNFSLRIVFQGGNSDWMIGSFEIKSKMHIKNATSRGPLFRSCDEMSPY